VLINQDPVMYRIYEAVMVYGMSYKAIIHEKVRPCYPYPGEDHLMAQFGDGIMSAIDFRTSVTRKPDPRGDRVVITLDGKVSASGRARGWLLMPSSCPTRAPMLGKNNDPQA
jgi:cyanate lyase